MIPSCSPQKVVTFFGKEHVNWSRISGVMIGRSWKIEIGKTVTKEIMEFSKLDLPTKSYHNSTNIGPNDMFFTKKYNYFSRETRWNHPFLSQTPLKVFWPIKVERRIYLTDTVTLKMRDFLMICLKQIMWAFSMINLEWVVALIDWQRQRRIH